MYRNDVKNDREIVVSERFSLSAWSEAMNCCEQDLLEAIRAVGNSTLEVDEYLVVNRKKLASGMDL